MGGALERAAARVCREAVARVLQPRTLSFQTRTVQQFNVLTTEASKSSPTVCLRAMGPNWPSTPGWSPPSPAEANRGQPRQRRSEYTGAALADARKAKERTHPELLRGGRCQLVVVAMEVGGRWSGEAATFIRSLAHARSRAVPAPLRQATAQAYIARWSGLLTNAAQTAFARSLLFEDPALSSALDGDAPLLSDLLEFSPTPSLASWLRLAFGLGIRAHLETGQYTNSLQCLSTTNKTRRRLARERKTRFSSISGYGSRKK